MYLILITPLAALAISQLSKLLIKSNNIKWDWNFFASYAGMPSSHAATTVSLTAIIALAQGAASPLFAVSLVFTLLVIRDALGVRKYLGQHSELLNDLIKDLRQDKITLNEKYPRLIEKIGHTPAEVIAGAALGLIISLAAYNIF